MSLTTAVEYLQARGIRLDETNEELVIRMLHGDFEKLVGLSFCEFCRIRNEILESHPEKLI